MVLTACGQSFVSGEGGGASTSTAGQAGGGGLSTTATASGSGGGAASSSGNGGGSTSGSGGFGGGSGGADVCGDGILNPATSHCYFYHDVYDTIWLDAEAACSARGPNWHLATIRSDDELTFVDDIIDIGSNVYIGGTRKSDGSYEWSNGEPWDYEHWEPGEPDFSGDCVELDAISNVLDGFSDSDCNDLQRYLCERTPPG
jgi:hypothetical protein